MALHYITSNNIHITVSEKLQRTGTASIHNGAFWIHTTMDTVIIYAINNIQPRNGQVKVLSRAVKSSKPALISTMCAQKTRLV